MSFNDHHKMSNRQIKRMKIFNKRLEILIDKLEKTPDSIFKIRKKNRLYRLIQKTLRKSEAAEQYAKIHIRMMEESKNYPTPD